MMSAAPIRFLSGCGMRLGIRREIGDGSEGRLMNMPKGMRIRRAGAAAGVVKQEGRAEGEGFKQRGVLQGRDFGDSCDFFKARDYRLVRQGLLFEDCESDTDFVFRDSVDAS